MAVVADWAALDALLLQLRGRATGWARLGVRRKAALLRAAGARVAPLAREWSEVAARAKGIVEGDPLEGEEWITGPYALAYALRRYARALERVADGASPVDAGMVRVLGGRVVVDVFPRALDERMTLMGYSGELWCREGVRETDVVGHAAPFYKRVEPDGEVAVVLGAGNIAAIGPLDLLWQLVYEGRVALLKLNPVNAYLKPFLEDVFAPFIAEGFVAIVEGGADVGAYLVRHESVDAVHVTGSESTYDRIVFGDGADGAARKAADAPVIRAQVTAELGNVSPVIVVPGPWSASDLAYQAAHIVTQKVHNGGFNCIAAQVLVTARPWERRLDLIEGVRAVFRAEPARAAYYPACEPRHADLVRTYGAETFDVDGVPRAFVTGLDPDDRRGIFETEAFSPFLAEVALPELDPKAFLEGAVRFCNERLRGSLGATILVHPKTARALGSALDGAIDALGYGTVAVNTWAAVGFLLPQLAWGASPGNARNAAGSGIGFVHDTYLVNEEHIEKSVVRGPFRPWPLPPWFVTNRKAAKIARALTAYECAPSAMRFARVLGAVVA